MATEFQREVADWAARTFPDATVRTRLAHIADEVIELASIDIVNASVYRALTDTKAHLGNPRGEAADIYLLLLALAESLGFDLHEEARKKFEICKARTWGEPDERGVVRHVGNDAVATG